MKILQIINSLHTGGAEKLVVESVPLYQNEGITVDVLSLQKEKTPFWKSLERRSIGKIQGLTRGSVYNPLLILKIIPHLKKYDVIHAHLFPTLYWVVLAKVFSGSKTPIIYTEHNTHNRRRDHFILNYFDRVIYKRLTKIVTIADEVDVNIKSHVNLPPEKFIMINNGVDVGSISDAVPLSKLNFFSAADKIIIQVSSFREQKDQTTIIKAMQLLPNHFKLLLVGDGPLRKINEVLVKDLELTDRIKFLGLRDDIPSLLKMSDYIVLSSHHEGLSLSSIEGMAAKKPFIASDVPGLREIVKGYGLVFPQGESSVLADHLTNLDEDVNLYETIANRCFMRAQDFDIKKMVQQYIHLFKKINKSH